MKLPVPDEFIIGKFHCPKWPQRTEFHVRQGVQNSLNFIPSNWGYFWNLDPYEMGTYSDIDHFLTNFNGEMLQIRLKTHQLITKADFLPFLSHD